MLEKDVTLYIQWAPEFPRFKVQHLGELIQSAGYVIPLYQPPQAGALNISAIRYEQTIGCSGFRLVADRNIVSRMAAAARLRTIDRNNPTEVAALNTLAFCQALDIMIDPSVSFYELADSQGKEKAIEELRWFRAADSGGKAGEWIDFALGCVDHAPSMTRPDAEDSSIELSLRRFKMNYLTMLKAVEITLLAEGGQREKFERLVDWCSSRLFVAMPAVLYASSYFSPKGPKRNAFKVIGSGQLDRLLRGARNAAWDATYLSELVKKVNEGKSSDRILFASNDAFIKELAVLISKATSEDSLVSQLLRHWNKEDALAIAARLLEYQSEVARSSSHSVDSVDSLTAKCERRLREVIA